MGRVKCERMYIFVRTNNYKYTFVYENDVKGIGGLLIGFSLDF